MAKEKDNDPTPAQVQFRKVIDAYAKQNPAKYEMKKAALEKKYDALA